MEFVKNEKYAEQAGRAHGEYVCTFRSDNHQVSAEVFQKDGALTAYVSIREDLPASAVTDDYLTPLQRKAAELGFEGRINLLYVGR